jgi:hypothetical protein
MFWMAYPTAAGSPGPFDRKSPAGFILLTSFAVTVAGTTETLHPEADSIRAMLRFMP